MAGNLVQINLLGTRFSIQTDQNPEYIQGLLKDLESRLQEIQDGLGVEDPLKSALIAALFLEDDLSQIKDEKNDPSAAAEVEKIRLNMIKSIDETLRN